MVKTIKIETVNGQSDKEFLKIPLEVVSVNGQKPMTVGELRKIDKLCTTIESATDKLTLEDEDFAYLKKSFMEFSNWNPEKQARKEVLRIAKNIEDA
ncbi:MAG: hypothetical protein ACMXYC_04385 [Candidatus Woesearchaeota archaeon]